MPEFDHPKGDENVLTCRRPRRRLDSFWKRLLFALHQFDINILLTSYITPESRILLWRSVQDRIRRIAPFLRLDDDPYLVISQDGCTGFRTRTPFPPGSPTPSPIWESLITFVTL